jgi:eukaryotic-like serine/threonine-protein kinase
VYRTTDSVLRRVVAIKLLADRYASDLDARARFQREGLAAARLSHEPHVVTVFDVGTHQDRPFIVMQYMEGGSLYDRIRSAPVTCDLALQWLQQSASALDAAHLHGVIHRDVKPSNLLLDRGGSIHVTDFGIASAAGFDTLTDPGTIMGTAGYLAPEQARGEPATPASDRYALAMVAFELLTGRRAFEADSPVAEAIAHTQAAVPSALTFAPWLPDQADAVLAWGLAKDPRDRPASSAAFVSELRSALGGKSTTTAQTARTAVVEPRTAIMPPPHKQRRRAPAYLTLGALAAGLTVLGIVTLGSSRFDPPKATTATRNPQTTTSTPAPAPTPLPPPAPSAAPTPKPPPPAPAPAPAPPPPPSPSTTPQSSALDGTALNLQGYGLMRTGDYASAIPLLERAVSALAGTGSLAEAYASYNLAYSRRALGHCDGVLELLARSEVVQGRRKEIERLTRETQRACEAGSPGKSKKPDKESD